jgi:hypothetical protein
VRDQIENFLSSILPIKSRTEACLRLFLIGCVHDTPEQEVVSTGDDTITYNELEANIELITRLCHKYEAVQLRLDIQGQDDARDTLKFEMQSTNEIENSYINNERDQKLHSDQKNVRRKKRDSITARRQ